jgi:antitoxin (DNA-binding transcriptional repressor) of toxin-antitoxin stability system
VGLRLSERAGFTVTITRRGHRVARVVRAGIAGRNTVTLRKRLRAGRYTLVAQAVDAAGNRAGPVKVAFRIGRR